MRLSLSLLLMCVFAAAISVAATEPAKKADGDVLAVNVLLIPDQAVSGRAQQINQTLRKTYPAGFALDASHVPHISVLHGYVRSSDLADLYRAVGRVVQERNLIGQQLSLNGLEHKPWNDAELTNIEVAATPELRAFQSDLVEALTPHLSQAGDASAFVASSDDPPADQQTIEYVKTFVQKHTGSKFEPHITVGISDAETARKASAQQAISGNVTITSVAVFQLGNVGTARKELWRYSP